MLITKQSQHDTATTYSKLSNFIEQADGISILYELDHSTDAKNVDMDMSDNRLMLLGNPGLTSPLIQFNANMGVDIPMRVLVFEENGQTYISYNDPKSFIEKYDIDSDDLLGIIEVMSGALDQITDIVIAE